MRNKNFSRRDFLRLAGVCVVSTLVASCSPKPAEQSQTTAEDSPVAPPPKEAIELQLMWETEPTENAVAEEVSSVFKEKTGISIKLVLAQWDEFEPKLMSMYAGNVAPDLLGTGGSNPHAERYVRKMVLGLNRWMDMNQDLKKDLWPSMISTYTIDGELIGMPMNMNFPGVYYNANVFEEAGVPFPPSNWEDSSWTWEAFIETARKLTKDKDGDGRIDIYGCEPLDYNAAYYYPRLWGGDVIPKEAYDSGVLRKLATDDQKNYEAFVNGIQARADAIYKEKVTPSPAARKVLEEMGSMLTTGVLGMEYTGSWAIGGEFEEGKKFGAAAVPIGGVNGSGTRGNSLWINPLQIVKTTKYPDQCFEYCKFYVSDKQALEIRTPKNVSVPSVQSAFEMYMEKWTSNPHLATTAEAFSMHVKGAIETATTDDPYHTVVGWANIADIINAELEPVWLGEKSAKEAIDRLIPLANSKLEETMKELGI